MFKFARGTLLEARDKPRRFPRCIVERSPDNVFITSGLIKARVTIFTIRVSCADPRARAFKRGSFNAAAERSERIYYLDALRADLHLGKKDDVMLEYRRSKFSRGIDLLISSARRSTIRVGIPIERFQTDAQK